MAIFIEVKTFWVVTKTTFTSVVIENRSDIIIKFSSKQSLGRKKFKHYSQISEN
jgi:hypothetical protein